MASVWDDIVGFLATIASSPAYLFLLLGFVFLLIVLLVVLRIRKIRNEEPWIHQAWGAKWKGRAR